MRVWIVSGGSLDKHFIWGILGKKGDQKGGRRDQEGQETAAFKREEEGQGYSETKGNCSDLLIGADRGAWFLYQMGIRPDYLIGDFDSVDDDERRAMEDWKVPLAVLPTHKDDTDTEAALNLALLLDREHYQSLMPTERRILDLEKLPRGAGNYQIDSIGILGSTGSRLDHVLGTMAVLGQALSARQGRGIPCFILDPNNRIRMADARHPLTVTKREQWGRYLSVIPFGSPCQGVTLRGVSYPLQNAAMDVFSSKGVSNEIIDRAEISLDQGSLLVIESRD